jgi:hypothetical protein
LRLDGLPVFCQAERMGTAAQHRRRLERHPVGRWLLKRERSQAWLAGKARISRPLLCGLIARKVGVSAGAGLRLWYAMGREVPLEQIIRREKVS